MTACMRTLVGFPVEHAILADLIIVVAGEALFVVFFPPHRRVHCRVTAWRTPNGG